jgi:hypothetical protein
MKDYPDLFAWADAQTAKPVSPIIINLPKGGNVIDALPHMLAKIRIEKAYRIPRPRRDAKIIANPRWHEREVA